MATAEAKLAAILQLAFSRSLKDLEAYLGLIGYLRQYILYYAHWTRPFQKHRTLLNCSVNVGGNAHQMIVARTYIIMPSNRKLTVFHHLQQLFLQPSILLHYNQSRQLYIDLNASKAFGFRAIMYHSKDNSAPPKKTSIKPIMFLSQLLTDAETQYWPAELKTAGLAWTIRMVRHYSEVGKNINNSLHRSRPNNLDTRQTNLTTSTATNKLNLHIIWVLEYF